MQQLNLMINRLENIFQTCTCIIIHSDSPTMMSAAITDRLINAFDEDLPPITEETSLPHSRTSSVMLSAEVHVRTCIYT